MHLSLLNNATTGQSGKVVAKIQKIGGDLGTGELNYNKVSDRMV